MLQNIEIELRVTPAASLYAASKLAELFLRPHQ